MSTGIEYGMEYRNGILECLLMVILRAMLATRMLPRKLVAGWIHKLFVVLFLSCGCKLNAEDRYKIDKTAMGEIMSRQEKETPGSDVEGKEVEEEEEEGEKEEDSLMDEEDQDLMLELEDILKTCSKTDAKPKGGVSELGE
jgi:hypothetical protein